MATTSPRTAPVAAPPAAAGKVAKRGNATATRQAGVADAAPRKQAASARSNPSGVTVGSKPAARPRRNAHDAPATREARDADVAARAHFAGTVRPSGGSDDHDALAVSGTPTAAPKKAPGTAEGLLRAGLKALGNVRNDVVARQTHVIESLLGVRAVENAAAAGFGFKKFEDVFDQRVATALARLGLPDAAEISALRDEVEQLRDEVDALRRAAAGEPRERGQGRMGAPGGRSGSVSSGGSARTGGSVSTGTGRSASGSGKKSSR